MNSTVGCNILNFNWVKENTISLPYCEGLVTKNHQGKIRKKSDYDSVFNFIRKEWFKSQENTQRNGLEPD